MEKTIFGVLFFLFILVRLRWPRGADNRERLAHTRELISSSIFTLSLLFCYPAFLWSEWLQAAHLQLPMPVVYIGGLCSLFGVILLEWVHRCLGKHFSPHLELREDHKIVQSGPYHYVRHPMYSSGLLFLGGNGLLSQNWIVLFCPLLSFVLLLYLRIADEENMLHKRFGEQWEEYTKKTGAILPRI